MNDRTKDYVFVSYSHADDISPILDAFEERGYNLVFDQVMSYGEEWDLNARRYIQNTRCKGVLSILSPSSLCSKPVLIETEYAARFKKNIFAILTEHRTLPQIYASLSGTLDENKLYVLDSMMDCFPPEQLYAFADSLDWDKIRQTFDLWGFHPTPKSDYEGITQAAYSSDIKNEAGRLAQQKENYYELDRQAIDLALENVTKDKITVLDLGCGNGSVAISRFADDPRVGKVIGVDVHKGNIAEANESAAAYGDKFSFHVVDLNGEDCVDNIRQIMTALGVESIDLVFAALVLHHLENPRLLLLRLYDIFDHHGKIIVRGSDDGTKLCYPENKLMNEIMDRYNRLIVSSDRENGRKIYGQLYHAGFTGIRMLYTVSDTSDKDYSFKEVLFNMAFGFRLNRVDALLEKNPTNAFIQKERAWLESALERFRDVFLAPDFWYSTTIYIAVAEVSA